MRILFRLLLWAIHCDVGICQLAKDIDASQDMLVVIFVRIEYFFKRLEFYTEVASTAQMTDVIVKIMLQVRSTLAIATEEINQGRLSELIPRK